MIGSLKSLCLPQLRQGLLLRDNESLWDTFRKVFTCELAGTVIITVHRSRLSYVVAIRRYTAEDSNRILYLFRNIQYRNILIVKEYY